MDARRMISGALAIALIGFVACKTPRERCYEENRCDSADAECMGFMAMLFGGMGSSYSTSGYDGTSNGTLNTADYLSSSSTYVTSGTMNVSTDAFDVYSISSSSSSLSVKVKVTDTIGSPACYAYTTSYSSSNTAADPKAAADATLTPAGTLSATAINVTIPYYGYLYIVCKAGGASDAYKLTTTPGSSFDSSSLLMLMCLGSSATCQATCNMQSSY